MRIVEFVGLVVAALAVMAFVVGRAHVLPTAPADRKAEHVDGDAPDPGRADD